MGNVSWVIEVARPPATVGVPLDGVAVEEVTLRGVGAIPPRTMVVASMPVGEDGMEAAGGRWSVEAVGFVAELQGSKGLTS